MGNNHGENNPFSDPLRATGVSVRAPHRRRMLRSVPLLLLGIYSAVTTRALAQERESVLDRIVHTETEAVTEIPAVPRLEEGLDLKVHRVNVGDAELHVEEEGSGTPLVLINGGPGGTHHYFHPWFGRAASYARVIYYDQRGTGLSDYEPGEAGYSVEQAVEDLDAIRRALGVDKWVLVGYSYGGFLAQYYTTIHPQNVSGLVLVGASPGVWADLGSSHQYDYITQAEIERMREIRTELRALREQEGWSRERYLRLLVYNNHINGDWKRQHFYKPTREGFAHIALYEWIQDANFNSIMNGSAQKVDMSGAFDENPIPTLLLEGKWDLTWGDPKPTLLSRNHPHSRMVVIEGAGHAIYSENPDVFFAELERFVGGLPVVTDAEIETYSQHLKTWRTRWQNSAGYRLRAAGWGKSGSQQIAEAYSPEWLETTDTRWETLRTGLALYDTERYEEALQVFSRLEELAQADGERGEVALALIWQGHMLDLLGRRDDAVAVYQRVVEMNIDDGMQHSQYGLSLRLGPYAAERIETPFERIENTQP